MLPASALFFDDAARLHAWLGHPGNDKYRDRVVAIGGVLKQSLEVTAYAVLIGAAQFVNAFCGIRRGPNAKLVFKPARGFNEGAFEIQIATRNGAGIAKGSPILIDYGPQCDFATLVAANPGREISDSDILAIKGIGPWTLQYIKLRGSSEPDIYLEKDLIVARQAQGFAIKASLAAPWRSYLTIQLWLLANQHTGET